MHDNVPVLSNGPAPYDAFQTAKAAEAEVIYPEAMEIAGEQMKNFLLSHKK